MFSSIASFLPSALHIGSANESPKLPQFSQDEPGSDDDQEDDQQTSSRPQTDQPRSGRKAREKSVNESFIIVRPPPAKSNHPLNLQVQLVPPNIRPPSGVASISSTTMTSTPTETDSSLTRTPSARSDASFSNYSTSSFASVASSSTSSRRAIVPLYNLQAHNVMTNVIVDAGTDAKIAKFQKRGIVLIDLASLEPVEVWGDPVSSNRAASINLNTDDNQGSKIKSSTRGVVGAGRPQSPEQHLSTTSSAVSLGSSQPHALQNPSQPQHQQLQRQPPQLTSTSATSQTLDSANITPTTSAPKNSTLPSVPSKRNIFGKLFTSNSSKKLNTSSASPVPSPASPAFPPSTHSQDFVSSTPKASAKQQQQQQQGSDTSSKNGDGRGERGGLGKTRGLTNFASPIRSTFKNNKNRLSSVIAGSSSSSSLNVTAPPQEKLGESLGVPGVGKAAVPGGPSPNMSASSLTGTLESVDSSSFPPYASSPPDGCALPQTNSHLQAHSHAQRPSTSSTGVPVTAVPQTLLQQLQSRPPVLSVQPTFVSALGSDLSSATGLDVKRMRALMYVWLIRRWLKQSASYEESGSTAGVTGGGGGGGGGGGSGFLGLGGRGKEQGAAAEPGAGVEARFEWKRAKVKTGKRKREGGRSQGDGAESMKSRRRSLPTTRERKGNRENEADGLTERERSRDSKMRRRADNARLSNVSAKSNPSLRSAGTGSEETSAEGVDVGKKSKRRPRSILVSSYISEDELGRDDGEESDPEDSETPWICTLKVRRTGFSGSRMADTDRPPPPSSRSNEVLKIKVATLSPTPHHPKVVAMLKVPFPLPDVEVERLTAKKRPLSGPFGMQVVDEFGEVRQPMSPQTSARSENEANERSDYQGLMLTSEEIKDAVCSTALWLVVREAIGGVGRVNRKGDGWIIRH